MLMTQVGYVYDSTVYYRARYYDYSIGRFISEDPVRFKGGADFYSYVSNRPLAFADPRGTCQWDSINAYWTKCANEYPKDPEKQCSCDCAVAQGGDDQFNACMKSCTSGCFPIPPKSAKGQCECICNTLHDQGNMSDLQYKFCKFGCRFK
jgi:RHS repeat-associated protein